MDLSHSEDLKEIPDISKATNLEELDLYCCSGFLELTNSIGNATKLKRLNLGGCWLLKELPFSIGNATNLQFLDLYHCASLEELPSSIGKLTNLEELELSICSNLLRLPSSIGNLQKLPVLSMSGCEKLETFPININLESLSEISLGGCTCLKMFPDISRNITKLDLRNSAIEEVPSSISSSWSCLYRLDMSECRNIKEFPNVPDSIVELELSKTGIEEIPPRIENLFRLCKLIMYGCNKLINISPNISKLENLEFLGLSISGIDGDDNDCKDNEDGDGEGEGDKDEEDADDDDGEDEDDDDDANDEDVEDDEGPKDAVSDNDDDDRDIEDGVDDNDAGFFDAVIEWGPDLKQSWTLRSDFKVHYILPRWLPEKACTSPISLCFRSNGFKTIPDCIKRLSGLNKLDIRECRKLVALPELPGSLLSLDAENCESLKRLDCSFENSKICLNFANCINLNQEARELIQTSACKYALLPGVEVPAHFSHQATSGSLTINLTPRPLPSSFIFKACILLSKGNINLEDHNEDENSLMCVSCHVKGKQNGLIFRYGSKQLHIPALLGDIEHLYIFEDSFSLNQDSLEAEEATYSKLVFDFIVHHETWEVKGCGVHLLEVPRRILDGKETEDKDCMDRNIETNIKTEGEESERDDDAETRSRKRMRLM